MVNNLSSKQIIAATVIAIGQSQKRAAEKAEVTEQTVSEWMKKSEFESLINAIKLRLLYEAQDKLRGLVNDATYTVSKTLKEAESERLRFEAAKFILNTINIAPVKEAGLWLTGPTVADDILIK